ncbi:MAG: protoporphyrinogen/coproporphyrinogen oxidase [Frankiaceae bacterium]|jgi:oxygen-dependent protoporphyrinogen oxidase|nr:protoporphyrinogen/coproporphyrinogen oxidase [Frankiaceae bacterium]
MTHVVVVGAGIAGAAAAYALRNYTVTVIDGAPDVGGKLRTVEFAGMPYDEGAEQFLARVPEAVDFARLLGFSTEVVSPRTSSAAVWSRGRLHALPGRTVLGVPSSVQSLLGVLRPSEVVRAVADLVAPGDVPESDVAVGAYLRRRVGDAVVDRIVDPLLGGVYAGRADDLSYFATMPMLRSARTPSVIRAARAVVGAGAGGPVFATLTGGLGQLVPAALSASGAEVLTGRTVRRIERMPRGFRVVHGPTTDERAIDADAMVVAVPAAPAARLLADLAPVAAAELGAIDYASVAIVSLAYPAGALSGSQWSGFLVPAVEGRTVKAATFSSCKWAHLGESDLELVRCSIGRVGEVAVLQRSDEELATLAAADLSALAGLPAPVESRLTRWGGGLPQYAVGHLDRVARIRTAVAVVPGLAVCGAAYDGVGIPACIRSGYAAAAQVATSIAR